MTVYVHVALWFKQSMFYTHTSVYNYIKLLLNIKIIILKCSVSRYWYCHHQSMIHQDHSLKLLEVWVDVEWLKKQQHQIKDETILFLQWKTATIFKGNNVTAIQANIKMAHAEALQTVLAMRDIQYRGSWRATPHLCNS